MQMVQEGYQMTLDDLGIWSGKMCREHSAVRRGGFQGGPAGNHPDRRLFL